MCLRHVFKVALVCALASAVLSCTPTFERDPRLYNTKKSEQPDIELPDLEITDDPYSEGQTNPFDTYNDPSAGGFDAKQFDNWRISASFDGRNVPAYQFSAGEWPTGPSPLGTGFKYESTTHRYNGPNTKAGGNNISSVVYYLYKGQNPLYSATSAYNTQQSKFLDRFYLYRFTGKTAMPSLDNCLIAVDTYTKLVFAYGTVLRSEVLLGSAVPKQWGPFETASSGPGGVSYRFWEYDPIGMVKSDGSVILFKCFDTQQAKGDYEPKMKQGSALNDTYNETFHKRVDESKAIASPYRPGENDNQTPVSGALQVVLVSVQNHSVMETGSWGDHGTADGWDMPEFKYHFRAGVTQGMGETTYESLAAYPANSGDGFLTAERENIPTGMPASAQHIRKGEYANLAAAQSSDDSIRVSRTFKFQNVTKDIYINLDARIKEINMGTAPLVGVGWADTHIADYGMPLMTLQFDRASQSWKVSDNGVRMFEGQRLEYAKEVSIKKDDWATFTVTIGGNPKSQNQALVITYQIGWGDAPRIFPTLVRGKHYGYREKAEMPDQWDQSNGSGHKRGNKSYRGDGGLDVNELEFAADGMSVKVMTSTWRSQPYWYTYKYKKNVEIDHGDGSYTATYTHPSPDASKGMQGEIQFTYTKEGRLKGMHWNGHTSDDYAVDLTRPENKGFYKEGFYAGTGDDRGPGFWERVKDNPTFYRNGDGSGGAMIEFHDGSSGQTVLPKCGFGGPGKIYGLTRLDNDDANKRWCAVYGNMWVELVDGNGKPDGTCHADSKAAVWNIIHGYRP